MAVLSVQIEGLPPLIRCNATAGTKSIPLKVLSSSNRLVLTVRFSFA